MASRRPCCGATDLADVALDAGWRADPTWQHVWRPSHRRHTCTYNCPNHNVRQSVWDLAVLASMCGADATGATLHGGADATGATHPLKCGARARPQPDPALSLLSLLSFSPPTAAAGRLSAAPHQILHGLDRSGRPNPSPYNPQDMAYDERYTEFIQPTGLLPFITLGEPLCMNTSSDGWRGQMQDLIGMAPPAPENPKERAPAGAPFAWIRTNFGQPPPEDANEDTIRTYTRVYLWYMISRTLFADSGGKLAHWCWLKALTVLERRWSWGTAALAYLYRQLDEACRRTGSGGIGGCLLLLSVWSWDRLSVGRPRVLTERPWPHYRNNLDREPTWAFLWDNVSEMTSDPKIMYRQYTEELDTLTAEQVEWEPYGTYYRIGAGMADLNPKCLEEARFWRMRCPLICMWLVEYHQPHRVMRQFGLYQECPPQWQDTDQTLHRLDRKRQRKITNWPDHHRGHVTTFQHCLEAVRNAGHVEIVPHDLAAFNNYLQWFHQSTRIELVKPAYDDDILDDPIEFDEVAQSQHDTFARRGRSTSIASELNFVVMYSLVS
ncbi:hypothetical protein QYE76_036130 [Lolium multiflorum]|uniref:Aminotransferase-like plant mobile domain-containing protein n=1 Tax=Lolium multiflorum TaxID=4521 RepID=A0AAD8R1F7_LOLMU|nr:hypothetical protein QYE76_036130 [Lolium multiflorum]